MKSVFLLIAILIVVNTLFCSCTGISNETAMTTESVNTTSKTTQEDVKITPDLPEMDYLGSDISFLVREYDNNGYWGSQEIYASEEIGEPINDAVYR